jgi:hypothetical protein
MYMTETTVESIFGTKAGIVWEALNKNGSSNIGNLVKATSLSREEVYSALGWLGRENKINVEKRGRAMVFALHEAEVCSATIVSTPVEDSVPKKQSRVKASVRPKKTIKTRKVKTPNSNMDAVKRALVFILSEFEANREPSTTQVSKEVGMDSRQLGKALSKLDIKSESTRREGKAVKIYPLATKSRVWELEALDLNGLQEMSEAKIREMKDDKEHNPEKYTIFD